MASNPATRSEVSRTSRRQLLATVGVVSVASIAGCNAIGSVSEPEGEGDTIEILVENDTDVSVHIAVRVEDKNGKSLFSRVYELDPHHLDESAGLETIPATVTVFTLYGTSTTWSYSPEDTSSLDCEGVDIGISLKPDGTSESWYGC